MTHLADCISAPERTKIHDQFIELLITLFRNLVVIPDKEWREGGGGELGWNLQASLFQLFAKESVFDALIFLCQDVNDANVILRRKMNLLFMEILYNIFSCFTAKWIMGNDNEEGLKIRKMLEEQKKDFEVFFLF